MTSSSRSVFLIGMMGAGKSTVGRLLAGRIGHGFVDADRELEERAGTSIANIFEFEGEAAFRERESQLLDELTQRPRIVLATGGGVILEARNRERLRSRGLVIYLQANTEEILRRTRTDTARPLLNVDDRKSKVDQLLEQRAPLYRECAHITIRSDAANPRRLVARLLTQPRIARLCDASPGGDA
jgi:shikimate kinase